MIDAFPSRVRPAARAVAARLAPSVHTMGDRTIGPVSVDGEAVQIPQRIYPLVPPIIAGVLLTPQQRLILDCLLSRHHDGRVRERAVRGLLVSNEAWVVPFVLQLVGEYVIEIVELIDAGLGESHRAAYGHFARENPVFIDLTRRRATSYWNAYYRGTVMLEAYAGSRVLDRVSRWTDDGMVPPRGEH